MGEARWQRMQGVAPRIDIGVGDCRETGRKGESMKSMFGTVTLGLGVLLVGTVFASRASAQCGYVEGVKAAASFEQSPWSGGPAELSPASLSLASEHDHGPADDPIVGFWKVTFVAKGNPDIPDGTVIDSGYAQWHVDGTEILNSSRPPATSNFCLGVWKNLGGSQYKLNHFALSSDLNGNMIGPANIREQVTLGRGGNTYAGTFTIDQFDLSGNVLAHIAGEVTATRITVDTPPSGLSS